MNVNECLSDFQFIGSSVRKLEINNNYVYLSEEEWKQAISNIDVNYSIEDISKDEENDNIFGIINLNLALSIESSEKKISVLLVLQGCFSGKSSNDVNFKQLLSLNGCTALYSIARSIVASTLSQCISGRQIILPMINVFKMVEGNNDKNTPSMT